MASAALELFAVNGFDETTVDDIAAAAGIGRRTFFRYFASKNDTLWSDVDARLEVIRARLAGCPPDVPLLDAIREAVVAGIEANPVEQAALRLRLDLTDSVPALAAHAVLVYAAWREVIAQFAARRLGRPVDDLTPQAVAYAVWGTTMAATRWWVRHGSGALTGHLDHALRQLAEGFPQR